MKSSVQQGRLFPSVFQCHIAIGGLALVFFLSLFPFNTIKSQNCASCCITSFPSLTVYQTLQTGHGIGMGIEAGSWNKELSKFSYFIGTSMVWTRTGNSEEVKTNSVAQQQTLLSFYVKGQFKVTSHLYVIAAPEITNLTYFEFLTGLRYVIPVTRIFGIGIEPAYAFGRQQILVNTNLHFALR